MAKPKSSRNAAVALGLLAPSSKSPKARAPEKALEAKRDKDSVFSTDSPLAESTRGPDGAAEGLNSEQAEEGKEALSAEELAQDQVEKDAEGKERQRHTKDRRDSNARGNRNDNNASSRDQQKYYQRAAAQHEEARAEARDAAQEGAAQNSAADNKLPDAELKYTLTSSTPGTDGLTPVEPREPAANPENSTIAAQGALADGAGAVAASASSGGEGSEERGSNEITTSREVAAEAAAQTVAIDSPLPGAEGNEPFTRGNSTSEAAPSEGQLLAEPSESGVVLGAATELARTPESPNGELSGAELAGRAEVELEQNNAGESAAPREVQVATEGADFGGAPPQDSSAARNLEGSEVGAPGADVVGPAEAATAQGPAEGARPEQALSPELTNEGGAAPGADATGQAEAAPTQENFVAPGGEVGEQALATERVQAALEVTFGDAGSPDSRGVSDLTQAATPDDGAAFQAEPPPPGLAGPEAGEVPATGTLDDLAAYNTSTPTVLREAEPNAQTAGAPLEAALEANAPDRASDSTGMPQESASIAAQPLPSEAEVGAATPPQPELRAVHGDLPDSAAQPQGQQLIASAQGVDGEDALTGLPRAVPNAEPPSPAALTGEQLAPSPEPGFTDHAKRNLPDASESAATAPVQHPFELKAADHPGYGFEPNSAVPAALVDHLTAHGVPAGEARATVTAISPGLHHALETEPQGPGARLVFHPQGDVAVSVENAQSAQQFQNSGVSANMGALKEIQQDGLPHEGVQAIRAHLGSEVKGMSQLEVVQTFGHDVVTAVGHEGFPHESLQDVKALLQEHAKGAGLSPAAVTDTKALQALGEAARQDGQGVVLEDGSNGKSASVSAQALRNGLGWSSEAQAGRDRDRDSDRLRG